jgi:Vitamin K-dependent gamma-carboxylase
MYRKLQAYLNTPANAASLAFYRIAFGIMMFLSMVRFALNDWIDKFYIAPVFHFTYYGFSWVKPVGIYTYGIFILCAIAALMVTFGYRYRLGIILFFLSFTYIELMDKTTYLNHYYFISVVSFVMIFLPANAFFSADAKRNPKLFSNYVPRYTVDILKILIAIVYFYAGLAKLNSDWLLHAMPLKIWLPANAHLPIIGPLLGKEWVAYTFSYVGMVYDLGIVFLLLNKRTRLFGFALVVVFHVLTRILFPIGIFPFVMIVSSLIFFSGGWHRRVLKGLTPNPSPSERGGTSLKRATQFSKNTPPSPLKRGAASLGPSPQPTKDTPPAPLERGAASLEPDIDNENLYSYSRTSEAIPPPSEGGRGRTTGPSTGMSDAAPLSFGSSDSYREGVRPDNRQLATICLLATFLLIQLILPFRYLVYPQELFWSEEGFRFSWRVMLMEKAGYAQFVVSDPKTGKFAVVDNSRFLTRFQEKQMAFQPDFILEYAHFLHDYYQKSEGMADPEVRVNSYVALNGRLSTPYIDPKVNLAKQDESLRHKTWILPFNDTIKGF